MLGEPVTGLAAVEMGFATLAVPDEQLEQATMSLAERLASGPTLAYAAVRALIKIWSNGGTPAADAAMTDVSIELFRSQDSTNAFAQMAKALEAGKTDPPKPMFIGL